MKYLYTDSDGDSRQLDELDQDILSSFNDNECSLFRFENGEFQAPVIDGEEDEEGEPTNFKVVRWVTV